MFRSCLLTLLLMLPLLANANTILLVGDSLSAGHGLENLNDSWPALLQKKLNEDYPNYTLINDSISGETTSNGLFKLPGALERYQPNIVMIEYGGNDGLRGLDLSAMKSNLEQMVGLAQKANAKVLLIGVRLPPNYGAKYTQAFQNIYSDLAQQYNTALVAKMLLNVGEHPELMQADGLHPNEKGQPIILENVWVKLEALLQ